MASEEAERQVPDLADEIAAAEARVDKVTDALARIGFSEPLVRRIRNEGAKALHLRSQLAQATSNRARPKMSVGQLLSKLGSWTSWRRLDPERARAALAAVVVSIVLTPQTDGRVRATLQLKNETAALVDGRLSAESAGCGGRI